MWTYFWMMYVDGGDARYANPTTEVLFAESSACLNALIAGIALYKWFESGKSEVRCIYALMFCAVMHIMPTAFYYINEMAHGYPNVDLKAAGNFWAKFIIANSAWFWMPFVVFFWCTQTIPLLFKR